MQLLGHRFQDHKSEEQICWECGFVIPRGETERSIRAILREHRGKNIYCGKQWHVGTASPLTK